MGIYPIGCQKKYTKGELPSRLLNSHTFPFFFFCKGEMLYYSMTKIASEEGYSHI